MTPQPFPFVGCLSFLLRDPDRGLQGLVGAVASCSLELLPHTLTLADAFGLFSGGAGGARETLLIAAAETACAGACPPHAHQHHGRALL